MSLNKNIRTLEHKAATTRQDKLYQDLSTFGKEYYQELYQRKMEYEKDPYSDYQNLLYKRALIGLKYYSQQEVKKMHPAKIERIKKVNNRAQHELNMMKQKKIINLTNKILSLFSKKNSLAEDIINVYSNPVPSYISRTSLKDLDIDKTAVIETFIHKGILPKNFKSL